MGVRIALAAATIALMNIAASAQAAPDTDRAHGSKARCEQLGYEEGSRKHMVCKTYLKKAEAFDRVFEVPGLRYCFDEGPGMSCAAFTQCIDGPQDAARCTIFLFRYGFGEEMDELAIKRVAQTIDATDAATAAILKRCREKYGSDSGGETNERSIIECVAEAAPDLLERASKAAGEAARAATEVAIAAAEAAKAAGEAANVAGEPAGEAAKTANEAAIEAAKAAAEAAQAAGEAAIAAGEASGEAAIEAAKIASKAATEAARAAYENLSGWVNSSETIESEAAEPETGESDQDSDLSDAELEHFFCQHTVDGNHAVAMKKRSLGTVTYFATVHGYPNNLAVCEEVLAPYNTDASRSAIPGEYFCEELR